MPTSSRGAMLAERSKRQVVLKPSEEATQGLQGHSLQAQTQEASSPSPPKRRGEEDPDADAEFSGCVCLRRHGLCSCRDDAQWLRAKRGQMTKYTPPHARRAMLQPASTVPSAGSAGSTETVENVVCRCLRRHGRCTCQADDRWLQRKRKSVEPYVPPHLKERQRELETKRQEIAQRAEEAPQLELAPNIRMLARRWEPQLEKGGFGFNPLQAEGKILCDDLGLEAECTEQAFTSQGVKALPVVQSGNYHFEVELLRNCQLTVGWSSAMSHATSWDSQAVGYASTAQVVHNNEALEYGLPYGRKGDVIGALLEWKAPGVACVSFMLNGRDLGEAYELPEAVPMQPQVMQAPTGLPLCLWLRKVLAYPKVGFRPLVEALGSADLCPFSRAVAQATTERASALITEEQLQTFMVPDAHVVELYDLEGARSNGSSLMRLEQRLAVALNIQRPWSGHLALLETEDLSCVLVALRRASHAERLIEGAAGLAARGVNQATATSRQRLQDWRAESGGPPQRLQAPGNLGRLGPARRLIHGSLQTAMPLSHLVEEKNAKRLKRG